ncbi:GT-D fold domain-containing glycosyltransferase [Brevibacterium casei]
MSNSNDDLWFDFTKVANEFGPRMLTFSETLDVIADPDISMARFGDSELKMLNSSFSIGFQPFSIKLQAALREVAAARDESLLLTLPPVFENAQWAKLWHQHFDYVKASFLSAPVFGDTAVSRPPCFNELKDEAVVKWKEVWDDKTVALVTGKNSRFEYYHDFFGNASTFETINAPAVDAFSHIDAIEASILSKQRYDLYLLSLGPTATILAHRLHSKGLKALDVGHLSASYAYYKGEGDYPEKIPMTRN